MIFNKSIQGSERKITLNPPLKSAAISQLSDRFSIHSPAWVKDPFEKDPPRVESGLPSLSKHSHLKLEHRSNEPLSFFNEERLGVRTPGNYRSKAKRKPKITAPVTGPSSPRKLKDLKVELTKYGSMR